MSFKKILLIIRAIKRLQDLVQCFNFFMKLNSILKVIVGILNKSNNFIKITNLIL